MIDNLTTELKPCPFCGGEVEIKDMENDEYCAYRWLIRCPTCESDKGFPGHQKFNKNWVVMDFTMVSDQRDELIDAWNTRTPEQAVAAMLGSDASAIRLAEWLHGITDEMRNVGASTMTPHELLTCYASDVDKVADSLTFAATLGSEINGDTSDGYHTFNELYHHRAVLFSVIVRDHRELAWKACKHHDGTMYDGMFIVGIETPKGQATYHYDLDPYWEMFDCEEREYAPEWDGHTPDDAIARIAELGGGTCHGESDLSEWVCSNCQCWIPLGLTPENIKHASEWRYCPHCGAKVEVNK